MIELLEDLDLIVERLEELGIKENHIEYNKYVVQTF